MNRYVTDQSGPDSLKLEQNVPKPSASSLSPTQVLVRIHAVSLNYRDHEVISGLYNHHKGQSGAGASSIVPCSDFGGSIEATGSSVKRLRTGDRVFSIFNSDHVAGEITQELLSESGLGFPLEGVLQEYRVFEEHSLVRIPKGLSYEEGSTLAIAAGTAWTSLFGERPLTPGQTVLVLGTGGGKFGSQSIEERKTK